MSFQEILDSLNVPIQSYGGDLNHVGNTETKKQKKDDDNSIPRMEKDDTIIDLTDDKDDHVPMSFKVPLVPVKEEMREIMGYNSKIETIPFNFTTHIIQFGNKYNIRNNSYPPIENEKILLKKLNEYNTEKEKLRDTLVNDKGIDVPIVTKYLEERGERVKKFLTVMNNYTFKEKSLPSICSVESGKDESIAANYINQYVHWASGKYNEEDFTLTTDSNGDVTEVINPGIQLKKFDIMIISSDTADNLQSHNAKNKKGKKRKNTNDNSNQHKIVSFSMLTFLDNESILIDLLCADFFNKQFKGKGTVMMNKIDRFCKWNNVKNITLYSIPQSFGFYWKMNYRTEIPDLDNLYESLNVLKDKGKYSSSSRINMTSEIEDVMYAPSYWVEKNKGPVKKDMIENSLFSTMVNSNFKQFQIKNIIDHLNESGLLTSPKFVDLINYISSIGRNSMFIGDNELDTMIIMKKRFT